MWCYNLNWMKKIQKWKQQLCVVWVCCQTNTRKRFKFIKYVYVYSHILDWIMKALKPYFFRFISNNIFFPSCNYLQLFVYLCFVFFVAWYMPIVNFTFNSFSDIYHLMNLFSIEMPMALLFYGSSTSSLNKKWTNMNDFLTKSN